MLAFYISEHRNNFTSKNVVPNRQEEERKIKNQGGDLVDERDQERGKKDKKKEATEEGERKWNKQ